MVLEIREQTGQRKGALARVGARFGITPRRCATGSSRPEIDGGTRPGIPTDGRQWISTEEWSEERPAAASWLENYALTAEQVNELRLDIQKAGQGNEQAGAADCSAEGGRGRLVVLTVNTDPYEE